MIQSTVTFSPHPGEILLFLLYVIRILRFASGRDNEQQAMAMQSSDRAGYDVLRDNFAEFCSSCIDPVCIASRLFQANLINSAVKDESTVQGCRRDLQLKTIIDAVMRQGKPGAFQEFTEIIATDRDSSWLADKFKSTW